MNNLDFQKPRSAQGRFATPCYQSRTIILLGPPGAGKGTQAPRIAQQYGLKHLSTGDMLRDNINRGTALAKKVAPLIKRGELVPDNLMLGMVRERISQPDCHRGFILDGFPRTIAQAKGLELLNSRCESRVTTVLNLVVKPELLVRRVVNRRICRQNGHIYNLIEQPPTRAGVCDIDDSELTQREDDKEAVVRERIGLYEHHTRPLVDYYSAQGLLHQVEAICDPDIVTAEILQVLNSNPGVLEDARGIAHGNG
ncbi:MAG TPA: adenylate kinase [Candidatus Acidoferrales bacterium]|nr:adenylate kinase [Candidatus Acidoferrales bacterium]